MFEEGKNARYSVFPCAIYYICSKMAKNVEKCEKLCEKSVDIVKIVRYNGGSLSKSTFRPLQKRKRKARESFEVACTASEYIFRTLRINNLELTMKRF